MKTIKDKTYKEIIIKNSKFQAYAFNLTSIKEFNEHYSNLKKIHKKATHICFAYKFNENNIQHVKYFDDGEPKGTAGLPIYSFIDKKDLNNICIFVVRYYGKIKLGAGGLIRAYLKAAKESVEIAELIDL